MLDFLSYLMNSEKTLYLFFPFIVAFPLYLYVKKCIQDSIEILHSLSRTRKKRSPVNYYFPVFDLEGYLMLSYLIMRKFIIIRKENDIIYMYLSYKGEQFLKNF